MPTLFLGKSEILPLLDMKEVIPAVENAFLQWSLGKAQMPPKSYLTVDKGDFRAMPASLPGAAGLKWVNVHPGNPAQNLPTVMAVIIYSDPETGYPLAVMDGTDITAYRTGAASAVASKYLACQNSRTLGLVGAGRQAYTQLMAHAAIYDLQLVKVYDISAACIERLIRAFPQYRIEAHTLPEVMESDIVCTVTPAHQPIVKKEWVGPGVHINAVGADAHGKEELDPDILNEAVIFVDDMRQASTSGEINVPLDRGLLDPGRIRGSLADLVGGSKVGRVSDKEITVFDSTGLAIEDIACARLIYEKVKGKEGYTRLNLIEG
ncbi:MAG: ornithine cyclodeaminase family protein [Dehalococcoidia bacterium]|nr:MAG: ornithine cyclodeaminase family protein [Dehalococcoidia bacterium]